MLRAYQRCDCRFALSGCYYFSKFIEWLAECYLTKLRARQKSQWDLIKWHVQKRREQEEACDGVTYICKCVFESRT